MNDTFEVLIEGLLQRQYGVVDQFISPELVVALRQQLLAYHASGAMQPAGIGRHLDFQRNLKVRGDVIHWLEKQHNAAEKAFLEHLEAFTDYLNQTCYAGINACEFHFALYDTGSFYKRHRDQFSSDQGRKFSMVTYLNDAWAPEDGGQLMLYPDNGPVTIYPESGRVVFFRADEVEHEVLPATRPRMSIAGWLKRV